MNKVIVHGVKKLVKNGIKQNMPWDTYEFVVGDEDPQEEAEIILSGSEYSHLTIIKI
tara:strand:- start:164 stop:334 length:171 start_codon:yes stop_codon:yes gene_type:complete